VAVIGPGPIGLYGCQFAHLEGAAQVTLFGTRTAPLELGAQLGADATLLVDPATPAPAAERYLAQTGGGGADVVLEATGNPAALDLALAVAARGARIALVSIYHHRCSIDPMAIVFKEARLMGSYDYRWEDFDEAIALLSAGRVRCAPLITHRLPLADIDTGVRAMQRREALKVILTP
jgi:L-iditol 2-dehydrogenase